MASWANHQPKWLNLIWFILLMVNLCVAGWLAGWLADWFGFGYGDNGQGDLQFATAIPHSIYVADVLMFHMD